VRWALATLLLTGCTQSVWVPGVSLPWDAEDAVPGDRMADDCTIAITEVVVGIPAGELFAGDVSIGGLPGNQTLQLVGASPTTLGEVRVAAAEVPTSVEYTLGNALPAANGPISGNATEAQREAVTGVSVGFSVTCAETAAGVLYVGPSHVACAVPDELEVDPQASFGTMLAFDVAGLFGEDPGAIAGAEWVDSNGDGSFSEDEVEAVLGGADLTARLAASSDASPCVITPR
jgi:hypothetical protein